MLTCTMLVAGRMAEKISPWARPIFSHSAMSTTNMRVRTTSLQARAGLDQRGFDIFDGLQRLDVDIAHADNVAVGAGRGGAGDGNDVADAHGARIADDRFPRRAAGNILTSHVGFSFAVLSSAIFC